MLVCAWDEQLVKYVKHLVHIVGMRKIECDEQLLSIKEQQYRMQRSQNAHNAQNVVSASGVDIEIREEFLTLQ